jgi:tRNA nucleotidyltransferase/poly(A) polymerase
MVNVYEVGGVVRDRILGRENKDIDFTVEMSSFEEMREWVSSFADTIYKIPNGEKNFCVRARCIDNPFEFGGKKFYGDIDFALCRRESGYSDGRHPDYVMVGDINSDLARRDFTMNAIARDVETGEIIDPFNGRTDIENHIIRAVGNASDRMNEDPLRLLRAMRFSVTLGFEIHNDIKELLNAYFIMRMVETVSMERIKDELNKMFHANTLRTLMILEEFPGISSAIFGEGGTGLWLKVTNEKR